MLEWLVEDLRGRALAGLERHPLANAEHTERPDMLVVAEVLDSCKVGDKVTVEVLRRGTQKKTLTVLLGERIPEITE
jgi:S1-C subfamily serine protease